MDSYKGSFEARLYYVMNQREQKKRTWADIGNDMKLSANSVRRIYRKAKRFQLDLYFQRIKETLKLSSEIVADLKREVLLKYHNEYEYAVADLEMNYYDILDEYRSGEPKSPYSTVDFVPKKVSPNLAKDVSTETWRHDLTQDEAEMLKDYDTEKSIKEIAESRGISEKDAQFILRTAKTVRYRDTVHKVCDATGLPFKRVYLNPKKRAKKLDEKYVFLLEILKKIEAGEPVEKDFGM